MWCHRAGRRAARRSPAGSPRPGCAWSASRARLVGGECPYWGCVPSKMMIRAANLLAEARRIHGMAGDADGGARLGAGGRAGSATRPPTTGTTRSPSTGSPARAAGSSAAGAGSSARARWRSDAASSRRAAASCSPPAPTPAIPPIDGLAGTPYWTNREAIEAETLPGVAGRARRRRDRAGAGAGVRPVRRARSPWSRRWTACWRSRSRRRPSWPRTALAATGSRCTPGSRHGESAYDGDGSRSRWPTAGPCTGRAAAGRHRPPGRPGGLGLDSVGLDPARSVDRGRRAAAGRRRAVGGRRRHRPRRVHARRDVPGRHRGARHPRPGRPGRRLPRAAPGHVHRSRGRRGRPDRGSRPATRGSTVQIGSARCRSSARGWIHKAGNEGFIKLVADADRGRAGRRHVGRSGRAARCSRRSRWRCTREVPIDTLRHMIYAYPTFHRGIEDALRQL